MSNQKILLFVDSESVQGALVKGYSSKEDMCLLVGLFWRICAEASIGVYIDRVPTDANPSDGASRGDCSELERCGAVRVNACPSDLLTRADPDGWP